MSERVRCTKCGKVVKSRAPKGGDGSALFPWYHKNEEGRSCVGMYWEAEPTTAPPENDAQDTRRQA